MSVNSIAFRATFVRIFLFIVVFATIANAGSRLSAASNQTAQEAAIQTGFAKLPSVFIPNVGQWDDRISFRADVGGATVWYTPQRIYFEVSRSTPAAGPDQSALSPVTHSRFTRGALGTRQSMIYALNIEGSNPSAVIEGTQKSSGTYNYFSGADASHWKTNVRPYQSITYREIYPGIDLRYYGNTSNLEYDFVLKPGVDPRQISLSFDGVDNLAAGPKGELQVATKWGTLVEQAPRVYQEVDGAAREIQGAYQIRPGNKFGFKLGPDYDPTLPLVIDPSLTFSSFIGGAGDDYVTAVAVDTAGYVYLAGHTTSTAFPVVGAYDGTFNGNHDIFVTKLNPNGSAIVYSTFIGGGADDRAGGIAVTPAGEAVVTGYTSSSDFPTQSPYDATANGGQDICISKLSAAGNSLVFSTYLGGAGDDRGNGVALDASNRVYIAAETNSSDIPTASAYDNTANGLYDAYAARLTATGSALDYATYVGGSSDDGATGIAVDNSNVAYLCGYTNSSNFPAVAAYDPTHNFGSDAFVAKLSATGSALTYSTFLGGSGTEWATSIARDGSNNMYITGLTTSNLYPTVSAFHNTFSGVFDAFVTKIASGGTSLAFSTFLGGIGADEGTSITVDQLDEAIVAGFTNSSSFPLQDPVRPVLSGLEDMFVTKFSAAGNTLVYSTFLGGLDDDEANGVSADKFGNAIVAGFTASNGFPFVSSVDSTANGGIDGAFAKITDAGVLPHIVLTPTTLTFDAEANTALPANKSFNITNGQAGSSTLKWYCTSDQTWLGVSHDSGQTDFRTITVSIKNTSMGVGTYTGHITISSPVADNSPQVVTVTYEIWNPVYPIILVHGIASDSLVWNTMKTSLATDGFNYVWRVQLDPCGGTSESNYTSSPRWLYEGNAAKLATAITARFNALPANIKTRVRKYDFIAHGMGGLVVRRYLSKSDLDAWTPVATRNVIMLGTPNDGVGVIGDKIKLYSCSGPATSELHTRRMLLFNSFYADMSGVDYYAIWGASGCSTTGSILPGCGGWRKLASRFLDCANDGSIAASSAVGQKNGYVDRYTKSYQASACYATLPTDPTVYTSFVRPILQGTPPGFSGDVAPVQPQVGFMFDSSVSAGATVTGAFPVESNTSMTIMMLASDSHAKFSIKSPSNVTYDSTSTLPDSTIVFVTDSLGVRGIYISNAAQGNWTWTVNASTATSTMKFSLVQAIDNSVKINRFQNLIYPLGGDTLRLLVTAKSGATRITGLTVTATPIFNDSTFGSAFNLLDNGASGDSANADGVYGKIIPNLDSGLVRYNITVTGTGPLGAINRSLSAAAFASGTACICGNVDGSFDGSVDISDLSRLIDYLYISFAPLSCRYAANVDGSVDNVVDIADLSALITYLYLTGAPVHCH